MQQGGLLSQRGNVTDLLIGLAATVSPPQLPNAAVMMPFDDVNGAHHMLTWTEKLAAYGNHALFESVTGGFSRLLVLPSGERPSFVLWQKKLYLFPGTGPLSGYIITPNAVGKLPTVASGSEATQYANPGYADVGGAWLLTAGKIQPRVLAVYKNSLALAGFPSPNETLLPWCNINDPLTLLADSKSLSTGGYTQYPIVWLAQVTR